MTYREKRDKFIAMVGAKKTNPEFIEVKGVPYVLLFDNDNMNDSNEVSALINASKAEGFNFVVLFEDKIKVNHTFQNILLYRLFTESTDTWNPTVMTLLQTEDRYIHLELDPVETNKVKLHAIV
jgi:hypothetical protein